MIYYILRCPITFFFFNTKWIHDICCFIYCLIYRSPLSPSSISQEASLFLFSKLLEFICKIFLEQEQVTTDRARSGEYTIKRPNQSVTAFLLQYNMEFCIVVMISSICQFWQFFLLWRFSIYQTDYNIFQNWWFHLEKGTRRLYFYRPIKWIKEFSSGEVQAP